MNRQELQSAHPEIHLLDPGDREGLSAYLTRHSQLEPGEQLTGLEVAGEGNMNCTLRASTTRRSLIVKQSRPWVEKYPQFEAPWDRACREAEFYRLIAAHKPVQRRMPRLMHFDAASRILILEDLGRGGDCSDVYRARSFSEEEISDLAAYLGELHSLYRENPPPSPLRNRAMRELNHAHVFSIPLAAENGLDLDAISPGLATAGEGLKRNKEYCAEVLRLGRDVYLADGPCLLHGDFFPGSFIRTDAGPFVIDPEFGFFGRPEWDAGVFIAHLLLASQPKESIALFLSGYDRPPHFEIPLVLQLAGVEIMRRLIGYAQLPLSADLAERRTLLELSADLVLRPAPDLIGLRKDV